ncbi:homing endonuclease [Aeromonas phage vB_ AhaP_PT2]|uniref:Homing endonuclease n=1 Tax=Aeromonas phage vB_ AhaP_PT2 TaxID=2924715 RepID=A0AC61TT62_9CAUD|nr:homing endonuclease [Aeromonas phage vB_ AhaP_PT2]
MYHRYVWIKANGEIPDGYEIDHKCKNRACCNIEHLQMLDRTTHLVKTNVERYAARKADAKVYWETTKCTGTKLAEVFGVSFSIGCKWIREWKV